MKRTIRILSFLFIASCESCKEHAVCCLSSDGTVFAGTQIGESECTEGFTLASREVDDDNDKAIGSKAEDRICGDVCCEVGDSRSLTSMGGCVERNGRPLLAEACDGTEEEDDDTPPASKTCRCDDPGVLFTVASGCSDPAFSDATSPSYCHSHVTENLGGDPATTEFNDGDVFGFPACQVRITCP